MDRLGEVGDLEAADLFGRAVVQDVAVADLAVLLAGIWDRMRGCCSLGNTVDRLVVVHYVLLDSRCRSEDRGPHSCPDHSHNHGSHRFAGNSPDCILDRNVRTVCFHALHNHCILDSRFWRDWDVAPDRSSVSWAAHRLHSGRRPWCSKE